MSLITLLSLGLPITGLGLLIGAVLTFLYLPTLGRYLAPILLAGAAGVWAYDAGYTERGTLDKSVQLQEQLAQTQAQLAESRREGEAAKKIADDASAAEVAARATADENQLKVEQYAAQLAIVKTPACALSDDDVRRLRSIGAAHSRSTPHTAQRAE